MPRMVHELGDSMPFVGARSKRPSPQPPCREPARMNHTCAQAGMSVGTRADLSTCSLPWGTRRT